VEVFPWKCLYTRGQGIWTTDSVILALIGMKEVLTMHCWRKYVVLLYEHDKVLEIIKTTLIMASVVNSTGVHHNRKCLLSNITSPFTSRGMFQAGFREWRCQSIKGISDTYTWQRCFIPFTPEIHPHNFYKFSLRLAQNKLRPLQRPLVSWCCFGKYSVL
jgi:hypothetical protein